MKKQMIAVFALALALSASAMASARASERSFTCRSAQDRFGGGLFITVTETSPYDGVIRGAVNGGMAHFIRMIGPYNVKIEHEADCTFYENREEGASLAIITTSIDGGLRTTATFKDGGSPVAVTRD